MKVLDVLLIRLNEDDLMLIQQSFDFLYQFSLLHVTNIIIVVSMFILQGQQSNGNLKYIISTLLRIASQLLHDIVVGIMKRIYADEEEDAIIGIFQVDTDSFFFLMFVQVDVGGGMVDVGLFEEYLVMLIGGGRLSIILKESGFSRHQLSDAKYVYFSTNHNYSQILQRNINKYTHSCSINHHCGLHPTVQQIFGPAQQNYGLQKMYYNIAIVLMFQLNYYQILGLDITSSEQDISKAFRNKIKTIHPDKNQSQDAIEQCKQETILVLAAYKTLKNVDTRKQYDLQLLSSVKNEQVNTLRYFSQVNAIKKEGKWIITCEQCMGSTQIDITQFVQHIDENEELIVKCWHCGLSLSLDFQA